MSLFSRFSLWLSKDPMQRTLYILVPVVHILLFIGLSQTSPSKKTINSKKLIVKTFAPSSSQSTFKTAATEKNTTPSKKPDIIKQKTPEPKKPTVTPPPKTKKTEAPIQKKNPAIQKEKTLQVKKQTVVRDQHLKDLEERIAKIEAKSDRMPTKSELEIPSSLVLNSLQGSKEFTISKLSLTDDDFSASLIGYLQAFLHLPELGEVQIQLTLRKDGKVENMKVITANSEKNKKYLEQELPKLSFPQSYLDSFSSRSFLLTFCNKF